MDGTPIQTSIKLAGVALSTCLATSVFAQQFRTQSSRLPIQSYYSNQLSACDIDGDGDLDFVVADGQGYSTRGAALKPRVYVNGGTGYFTDETDARVPGVSGWFRGVEFGDCDGDGDYDMILAQDFYERPLLLINDGSGVFSNETEKRLPDLRLSSTRAQFGDLDGDGDLDIALCDSGTSSRFGSNGRSRIFVNDGTGHYVDESASRFIGGSTAAEQMDLLLFDSDGDLDLDIYVATRATGTTGSSRLWVNDGAGHFSSVLTGGTDYYCYSYDAGDIDGDADLDLIGANGASSNREKLVRNDGGAAWFDVTTWISPNPSADDNDSKFLDVDDDGDLDLVIATLYGSRERIYRNDGTGHFTEDTSLISSISDATLDIAVADFTGDGKPDIITVQGEGGDFQNRFYLNTGPADTHAPRIVRQTILDADAPLMPVVLAAIEDAHTSDRGFHPTSVTLESIHEGGPIQSTPMRWVGNSIWRGEFERPGCGGVLSYRVSAGDPAGNVGHGEWIEVDFGGSGIIADINNDGFVDGADLTMVLGFWNTTNPCADLNHDGLVNGVDLTIVLGHYGRGG